MKITTISIATTGVNAETDEILRITCAVPAGNGMTQIGFDSFVKPVDHVTWDSRFNNIEYSDVVNAPSYSQVKVELEKYLSQFDLVICYSADFVSDFLFGINLANTVDLMETVSSINGQVSEIDGKRVYRSVSKAKAFDRFGISVSEEERYNTLFDGDNLLRLYNKIDKYYPDAIVKKYLYQAFVESK